MVGVTLGVGDWVRVDVGVMEGSGMHVPVAFNLSEAVADAA
jgi:hypothetical protein